MTPRMICRAASRLASDNHHLRQCSDDDETIMNRILLTLALITLIPFTQSTVADDAAGDGHLNDPVFSSGSVAFDRGQYERAISLWKDARKHFDKQNNKPALIDIDIQLSAAYQSIGEFELAVGLLSRAFKLAEAIRDKHRLMTVTSSLGAAFTLVTDVRRGGEYLRLALLMAEELKDDRAKAVIQNNVGNLHTVQGQYAKAIDAYRVAGNAARASGDVLLESKALVNAASAALTADDIDQGIRLSREARDTTRRMRPSNDQAFLLIMVGETFAALADDADPTLRAALIKDAYAAFNDSVQISRDMNNVETESHATGRLAALYERLGRLDDALHLSRRAIFLAQQQLAYHLLYQWHWLTGRILAKQNSDDAIAAYRRAVSALRAIRYGLLTGFGNTGLAASFRKKVGPLFLELADLLLDRAAKLDDKHRVELILREVRTTVELVKCSELTDYYQDDCIRLTRTASKPVDDVADDTAIIYVVSFDDRTELLLSAAKTLKRFNVGVPNKQLEQTVLAFRRGMENRMSHSYMPHSQSLYDWLIRPLEKELSDANIQTLVFVPDGALRTVPMAALHDGDQFLIERFAVAITPGLTLTDPRPIDRAKIRMLKNGLSQPSGTLTERFPPLPHVPEELKQLDDLFGGETLMDNKFVISNFRKAMTDDSFSVVHIASHGQFRSAKNDTFLLTYEGRLTLDGLEQLIRPSRLAGKPVELLTLSACQTAAGDDRAALGLAGIAIKAGARSALATLWFINDEATTRLITAFYRELKTNTSISKAKALQNAQRQILSDVRYEHPCYWAPFLIIGNWL